MSIVVVQITDIPEEDIVFVRFEADVIAKPCLPYFIALDRDTTSVGTDGTHRHVGCETNGSVALRLSALSRAQM